MRGVCVNLRFVMHYVHFSFDIILKRKRKLIALLLLSYGCLVTVYILWLFLTVPWVGLQCVIEVWPDHTYLLHRKTTLPSSRYKQFKKNAMLSVV